MFSNMMRLVLIDPNHPLYAQERALRYEILRKPLGMEPGSELFPQEEECLHLVALEEERVLGCVLFRPQDKTGRLFAMAVSEPMQGKGVGTKLVRELIRLVRERGFHEIFLHARDHALGFYERLGFQVTGDPFLEVGIRHLRMQQRLLP